MSQVIVDSPDSDFLPEPSGTMYEFYEGLDSNLFSESTGINHNAAPKWLKSEVARHLEFLSYLLSVKSGQAVMSDNIVHTDAILDDQVDINKLHPDLRYLLQNISIVKLFERNSVQTMNCISLVNGKIRVKQGALISQADGFNNNGQVDIIETLDEVDIEPTTGSTLTGYLYKVVGGSYLQYTTKQTPIDRNNMIGTKVLLGMFKVDSNNLVTEVTPAVPTLYSRTIEEPIFTGDFIKLPTGPTSKRPSSPTNGYIRFNEDTSEYEGYKIGRWDSLGGGQMLGQAQVKAISYNAQTISENITIGAGLNAWSVGDITINDGYSITLEENSVYKIL